jgi:hypothetical protein
MRSCFPYFHVFFFFAPVFLCHIGALSADVVFPESKRSVEHREKKKSHREERKKYKTDIKKAIKELSDLPEKSEYNAVKEVVRKVRETINAYNKRYHHPLMTRQEFKKQFHNILLAQRAQDKHWDKSRHAMRRYQRQICAIMFPEHVKSQKYKYNASLTDEEMHELHDKYCLGIGPLIARDLGWCAGGVALAFTRNERLIQAGSSMIMQGSWGLYSTSINVIYPYIRDWEQTPASEEDKRYLRQYYDERYLYREPFYNMSF